MTDWTPPNAEYPPPKIGEPALHRAARLGLDDEIRSLIAGGHDVNATYEIQLGRGARPEPASPLMVAAGSADGATRSTVEVLLDLGAALKLEACDVSALWYGCGGLGWNYPPGGDSERVDVLLRAGSDPNVCRVTRDDHTITALAKAAGAGDPQRVQLLIEAGAQHSPGRALIPAGSPLHQAAESGSGDCVRLLITAGADPNAPMAEPENPPVAYASSAEALVALLDSSADPNAACGFGSSVAGQIADQVRDLAELVAMLNLLVGAGVDLDRPTPDVPPIFRRAMNGDDVGVEALLMAGADPQAQLSALGAACFLSFETRHPGVERVIDLVVGAGVDVDDEDEDGFRPFDAAVAPSTRGSGYRSSDGFSLAAAVALLENGASISRPCPGSGYTPLHAAAAAASSALVELLLDKGASESVLAQDGSTPLDVAVNTANELAGSGPTLEQAQSVFREESRARRQYARWLEDHEHKCERADRCISLLKAADSGD